MAFALTLRLFTDFLAVTIPELSSSNFRFVSITFSCVGIPEVSFREAIVERKVRGIMAL